MIERGPGSRSDLQQRNGLTTCNGHMGDDSLEGQPTIGSHPYRVSGSGSMRIERSQNHRELGLVEAPAHCVRAMV